MNKYLQFAVVAAVAFTTTTTSAQAQERCITETLIRKMVKDNPALQKIRESDEEYVQSYILNSNNANKRTTGTGKRVIPVVFHLIHQWGGENITRAQCLAQIKAMNLDWNRANADTSNDGGRPAGKGPNACFNAFANDTVFYPKGTGGRIANCNIEFRLATKDPYGRPTDGIDRIASFKTYDDGGGLIKSVADWDSKKYINIWLAANIASGTSGLTTGGYGVPPAFRQISPYTDGVVILTSSVGLPPGSVPGFSSRVLTHEIGHSFDLIHIWGDAPCGNDHVDDTPIAHDWNLSTRPDFPSRLNKACIVWFDSTKCIRDSLVHRTNKKDTIICACVDTVYRTKHTSMDSLVHCGKKNRDTTVKVIERSAKNLATVRDTVLGEMYINYMDYTDETYQIMFTKGQLARVNATLDPVSGTRSIIASQSNLVATGTDDASYPTASQIGGKPHAYYYVNNNYINSKVYTCAGNALTFKDSSTNGHVQNRQWIFSGGAITIGTTSAQVATVLYNTPGEYDVTLIAQNANGSDTIINKGSVVVRASSWYRINFKEDFESPYYTDHGWSTIDGMNNYDDSVSWKKTTSVGYSGKSCMVLRNYDNHHISKGDIDELISPPIEITNSDQNVALSFYSSFAKKTTLSTAQLQISYSLDCGKSFTALTMITNNNLANAGVTSDDFVPTQSALWKKWSFPIPAAVAGHEVVFKFRFYSSSSSLGTATTGANNFYIDDIGFDGTLGIEDVIASHLNISLFPNPAANETNLTFNLEKEVPTRISICDVTGRVLGIVADEKLGAGEHQYPIANKYGAGVYMLRIKAGEYETVRKLIFN